MRQNCVHLIKNFFASWRLALCCSSSTRERRSSREKEKTSAWDLFSSWEKKEKREFPRGQKKKRAILHNYTHTKHTNALLFFFFTRSRGRERERERECAGVCVSLAESESFVCSRGRRRRRREGGEKARSLSLSLSRENLENNI